MYFIFGRNQLAWPLIVWIFSWNLLTINKEILSDFILLQNNHYKQRCKFYYTKWSTPGCVNNSSTSQTVSNQFKVKLLETVASHKFGKTILRNVIHY